MTDKIPPHDNNIEVSLLGTLLTGTDMGIITEVVTDQTFYKHAHQLIYQSCERLHEANKPVNIETVTHDLSKSGNIERAGGIMYLMKLTNAASFNVSLHFNAHILQQLFIKRQIITLAIKASEDAYKLDSDCFEIKDELEGKIKELDPKVNEGMTANDVADEVKEYIEKLRDGEYVGIPTGFRVFDELTDGMQKSDLIVIGSYSSNGKTATALNIMNHAASKGFKGKFYTLEQSLPQLYIRQLVMLSGINRKKLLHEDYGSDWVMNQDHILRGHKSIYAFKLTHVEDIIRDIKSFVKKQGGEFVIIDYLQKMNHSGKDDKEYGKIAGRLQGLAIELNIPIVLISQLRRIGDGKKGKPTMSLLKESGGIENAADVVWLPWIPINEPTEEDTILWDGVAQPTMVDNKKLMLHYIAKGRNYGTTRWKSWISDSLEITDESVVEELPF